MGTLWGECRPSDIRSPPKPWCVGHVHLSSPCPHSCLARLSPGPKSPHAPLSHPTSLTKHKSKDEIQGEIRISRWQLQSINPSAGAPSELRALCSPLGLQPEKPAQPEGRTQLGYESQLPNSHPSNKAPDMHGSRGSVGVHSGSHGCSGTAFPALGCACGRGGQSLVLKPCYTAPKRRDLRQVPSFLTFLLWTKY